MHGDILDVVNTMIDECGKKLPQIAEEIGKPYPTLKRELNEFDEGAKLGAATLLPLMRACDSDKPIQHLAARMGLRLISFAGACPDKGTLAEELLDDLPPLAAYHEAMRAGRPVEEVNELLQGLISDLEADFVAYRAELASKASKGKVAE